MSTSAGKEEVEVEVEMVEEVSARDSDPLLDNRAESPVQSSEIVDEEIDASSAPCCRICLESDGEPGKNGGFDVLR